MGAKVQFKIVGSDKFTCPDEPYTPDIADQFQPPYSAGQIIFVEDTGGIYVDFHDWRREYGKKGSGGSAEGGFKFRGTSVESPLNATPFTGEIELIGGAKLVPQEYDMVAYKTKEYVWRRGPNDVFWWYELGDEDSPEWDAD